MAQTPARRSTPATKKTAVKKTADLFEQVSELDDDGNYRVKILGEEFVLSSDVNGWLLMLASAGSPRHMVQLVQSILVVEPEEGEKLSAARRRVQDHFDSTLIEAKVSVEDIVELIGEMMDAAGNDDEE